MNTFFKTKSIRENINAFIDTEAKKIYDLAYAKGRHWGLQEMPALHGDHIAPYLAEIKAKCEQLALKILQKLKPALHVPQGKIDADWADMHHQRLGGEIKEMDKHIALNRAEIGNYNPEDIRSRKSKAFIMSVLLFLSEIGLNSQAFQVLGDNFLVCLFLASAISLAVGFGAHVAGRQYKDAKTRLKRWVVVLVSFICMSGVSYAVITLREEFQKSIGVQVNPMSFVIINMTIFLAAAIASWYLYPTKEELEEHNQKLEKYKALLKLLKQRVKKVKEQVEHELSSKLILHEHLDKTMEAEYALERIKGIYAEAVGTFINANMLTRREIPDCFRLTPPPLNIPHISFGPTINKYKTQHHENNPDNYLA